MKWEMGGGLRREGTYVCVFCCSVVYNSFSPIDCSLPGSSANGILQARILEWAAISSSRVSSRPRNLTSISCVSCMGSRILYYCANCEVDYTNYSFWMLSRKLHQERAQLYKERFPSSRRFLGKVLFGKQYLMKVEACIISQAYHFF